MIKDKKINEKMLGSVSPATLLAAVLVLSLGPMTAVTTTVAQEPIVRPPMGAPEIPAGVSEI